MNDPDAVLGAPGPAEVHAAWATIARSIGPLAASPLSERSCSRLQAVLGSIRSPGVFHAICRLAHPEPGPRGTQTPRRGAPPAVSLFPAGVA